MLLFSQQTRFLALLLMLFVINLPTTFCDEDDDDTLDHYIVDVLAVVDKPMLDYWIKAPGAGSKEKVIEEIKSLFFEVNFVYQSLRQYNLSIEIRLKDIAFPNSSMVPTEKVTNNVVDGTVVGNNFARYLSRKGFKYDHAMYITRYNLKGSSIHTRGSAYVRAACKKYGTSRIEGRRDYNTVRVAAHELGHSLGASHDNQKNPECKGKYIMSTGVSAIGSPQFWYFSKCSANAMKRYIKSLGKNNCLRRSRNPPIISKRMGELVHQNSMCKRLYGNKVSPSYAYGDKLCYKLRCSTGKWVQSYVTPEGVTCDKDKKCSMGRCV
ncbi:A disintegrin and metalloproteinase with thrombospondin motifs 6 [Plakobranchus ocellatus]|uniref:A disintegrin and metalloproteinase with thrombospondin motifs 6 n=1 Tax=Plakobranchus ocellatus TaxID=259542 RepID=A0AAV3ZBU7_9GAST|nr:A disintegrin and metalloproteinase with thrombospondin motifs 6 [Plakobranchus ocellatus]